MCITSTKLALGIAVKYSASRLTVGPSGKSDFPIMNYQLQQRALVPFVAQAYALSFALNFVKDQYAAQLTNTDPKFREEVVRLCCTIKPLVTWLARGKAGGQKKCRCFFSL